MTKFFLIFLFLFSISGFNQSIENFITLKSAGLLHADFTTPTLEKYRLAYDADSDATLDQDFFISTRFSADEILLSGKILFNEPVSNYVNEVADYLFADDLNLRNQLRFYVLKSTVPDAFSTDDGIIIFTTALLAQLDNEAQLAFLMAREVAHYTSKHIRKEYVQTKSANVSEKQFIDIGKNTKIKGLAVYTQEREIEADRLAVDMYLSTDYAVGPIYTSFDVLLYAALPVEDIQFDTTFFNSDLLYVPGSLFPDTIIEIEISDEEIEAGAPEIDIPDRIDRIEDYVKGKNHEGSSKFKVSEEKFKLVRTLARFEGINIMLSNRDYANAVYNIFLLQRKHPENKFLELSLLKAIYGLCKYKNHGRYNEVRQKKQNTIGEGYKLHVFFNELTKEQLNVIALRYVTDLRIKYPELEIVKLYEKDIKKELVLRTKIKLESLQTRPFLIARDSLAEETIAFDIDDSIVKVESSSLSKFDKISLKKKLLALKEKGLTVTEKDFHLFALSDLVNAGLVLELEKLKKIYKSNEEDAELEKEREDSLNLKKIVIYNPTYSLRETDGNYDRIKGGEKTGKVSDMYTTPPKKLEIETTLISKDSLTENSVEDYHRIGVLFQWSQEVVTHDDIGMIASTHDQMMTISKELGTKHFLFSSMAVYENRKRFTQGHAAALLCSPCYPFLFYDLISNHARLSMVAYSVNSEKDEVEYVYTRSNDANSRDYRIGMHVKKIFRELDEVED